MSKFASTNSIRSWGGVLALEHKSATPAWRDELPELVAGAAEDSFQLLASGLRRSYGDSGLNPDGGLIEMNAIDRIIAFDPVAKTIRAEAGISLAALLPLLVRQGLFLPVTPGTRFVTLGGAVANDVHGKNHHVNGTIGRWVKRLGLLRSDGAERELTHEDNTGLFAATIGGLGLTGLITWVELELVSIESAMIDGETIPFGSVDEFFTLARDSEAGFEHTVSWIDCLSSGPSLGRGLFTRGNHAKRGSRLLDSGNTRLTIPVSLPTWAMNNYSIRAFNAYHFWNGKRKSGQMAGSIYPFFYPLDSIGRWNRMYGGKGMYQYQSVIPPQSQVEATRDMLKAISASGQGSFLAVLKTFGDRPSPGLLSFPRVGTTLALDFPNRGDATLKLMARLDEIVLEAGGRLYPAKDGRISARMFQAGYPNWQEFASHKDPAFSSYFWKRVSQ